jgi:hypothetical protein
MSYSHQPSRHSASGSSLVLTLLITALLATIVVSFLSTSRIEQIAARNFSRQNAASGLAELATQQAMAKIQLGFNATGNGTGNGTSVLTTQPGAIKKYFFSNGTLQTNSTITTELFSSGSGNLSYLNNLRNPSSNATLTSNSSNNQWTITGNASERINVPMENITSDGTLIGRIAYYVDDEGTKLNVNSATGNRTTLNVGARPQDIAALISGNHSANFTNTINGTGSNATSEQDKQKDVKHWAHFFRPEQVHAAVSGFSGNDFPFITTATSSGNTTANMAHLLTPWGTQRVAINTLSTNATDGTGDASVSTIHAALTNSTLSAIFGSDFGTKYTSAGVKQIAANMLQLRDANTFLVNASFSYNGSVLHDTLGTTGLYRNLPTNYSANTPFPVVNEIAATAAYGDLLSRMRLVITFWIELYNPYNIDYLNTTNASVCFMLDKIQFQTTATGNTFVGVDQGYYNYQTTTQNDYYRAYNENNDNIMLSSIRAEPQIKIPNIQSRSTETIRVEFITHWWRVVYPGISDGSNTNSITGDITVGFERIAVLANNNDPNSIRDGISGNDTGGYNITTSDIYKVNGINANNRLPQPGSFSVKRIDPRIKATANGGPTNSVIITTNNTITKNGSASQDNIVPAPDSTSGNVVPGDPILSNNSTYLLSSNSTVDKLPPVLDFPAFSSPADLGKVPTNTLYRSLRMQMQPAIEGTRIPDWAMLDVISFGNSTDPNHAFNRFQPVNINGKFYLPGNVINSSPPTPRTIGLKALAKGLEISANGTLQNPIDLTQSATLNATNVTRFKGNTANASVIATSIGNMTWSTNSTWDTRRNTLRFPADQYILPSEIMEIAGVADAVSQTDYNNSSSHFKRNEGRASALIPAVTTRSSFFTIYAYAQAGRENPTTNQFEVDSEALTKTLVEVEITTPATATSPAQYKVKKLYTQNLPMGN